MSLKSLERVANMRLLDQSLGIEPVLSGEQWEVYKRLKKKFPGKSDRGWLRNMRQSIKDDTLLEKFLSECN